MTDVANITLCILLTFGRYLPEDAGISISVKAGFTAVYHAEGNPGIYVGDIVMTMSIPFHRRLMMYQIHDEIVCEDHHSWCVEQQTILDMGNVLRMPIKRAVASYINEYSRTTSII